MSTEDESSPKAAAPPTPPGDDTAATPPAAAAAPPLPPGSGGGGGAGAGAGAGAGSGSSPAVAGRVAALRGKPKPRRPSTKTLVGSGLCLTRLYKDRVERFKVARAKKLAPLSVATDSDDSGPGGLPSPPMTPGPASIEASKVVSRLPRGGYAVETAVGTVQVGSPPESIKDHMSMGTKVPTYFVVPQQRFDRRTFVNLAEIEFPTFFNFFVLRQRVRIIATPDAIGALRAAFRESLLGPESIDTADEFDVSVPEHMRPDVRKELDWFSMNPFDKEKRMTVETLVDFIPFQPIEGSDDMAVELDGGVSIRLTGLGTDAPLEYLFKQEGEVIARVPDQVDLPDLTPAATELFRPFQAPTFGVTFLGTSHGFDPDGQTTGFVIWINGQGVMVDPPPHSSVLLKMMGIPPRLVDTIILTHCHADHDAGTLQKILEEGQVTIMATSTVMGSFVRKYSCVTGIAEDMLRDLFKFRPVRVGAFLPYRSAHFRFFYALHAVPCTGFEVYLGGQSMVYSADTFNDPSGIEKMYAAGVMTAGRRDALINFPWHHTIVLHEAGVPPIHTPVSYLASLDEDIKRRIRLVHVTPKSVPKGKGLQLAREGPENTIRIPVELPPLAQAVNLMDLVSNVRFLQQLSLADARLLLQLGYVRTFAAGKPITVRHSQSPLVSKNNEFFMVASGIVQLEVSSPDAVVEAGTRRRAATRTTTDSSGFFTVGDYFPRELLRVQATESSSALRPTKLVATAQTQVQCVVFNELEFWTALTEHGLLDKLGVAESYLLVKAACARNKALGGLTSRQRKAVQRMFGSMRTVPAGSPLWTAGDACEDVLLLQSGHCEVGEPGSFAMRAGARFGPGALIAEVPAMRHHTTHTTTVTAVDDCVVFSSHASDFMPFLRNNPSLLLTLCNDCITV